MNILGLSCFYHDSAACLLREGRVVAAASEERFTRLKHDSDLPLHAIRYCLEEAGLRPADLDAVAYYDKPLRKFDRLLRTHVQYFPNTFKQFVSSTPRWMATRLRLPALLKGKVGYTGPVLYSEHHLSHAASAFFTSGMEEAAVLTVDGVGEWATASWGVGRGNHLELKGEIRFPHSLGLLYSAITLYCGFKVNSAEYKLMGLAPYGEPRFVDALRQTIRVAPDGTFRLDMRYFEWHRGGAMFNAELERLLGRPARPLEAAELDDHYKHVARSVQVITEEVMVKLAAGVMERTGLDRLCLAGGVALNCVANGRILTELEPRELYIQPAAGDAGGAMGAALLAWHHLLGRPNRLEVPSAYLGPGYTEEQIQAALDAHGAVYVRLERQALLDQVAELIDTAHVVGWFQGRMEWGPRALGHRSILGDARHPEMRSIMNMKIKFREGFRPFAPTVLEEWGGHYFELDVPSPHMLLVANVRPEHRSLHAITHVDGTARVQTIRRDQDALYYDLIDTFRRRTGCAVVVNTSMNVRGEPIVCTPEEGYLCFMRTHMDALAMGPFLLLKEDQPELKLRSAAEEFGLD